jgi:hypothetical protein
MTALPNVVAEARRVKFKKMRMVVCFVLMTDEEVKL